MQNQAAANRSNHCVPWVHGFIYTEWLIGEFEVTKLASMGEYWGEIDPQHA